MTATSTYMNIIVIDKSCNNGILMGLQCLSQAKSITTYLFLISAPHHSKHYYLRFQYMLLKFINFYKENYLPPTVKLLKLLMSNK